MKQAISLLCLVIAIMMYLSVSHIEYQEDVYRSIPDSTLKIIHERLDQANMPHTQENILYEYKQLKN